MLKQKKFTLKNGVRVIVVPHADSPSVTIAVLVQAGSAYERKTDNGISHFLEHMCFKGTQKRPTPMAIAEEFESMGASFNAFTSRDVTGYWGKVAYPNRSKMMDLLSDMYLNPVFDAKEIEKEKGVIIEEINMYEDQPQARVAQELEHVMYGNQPAGWSIAGTKENVKKTTRGDFISYRSAHYVAPKTIVVIAGRVGEKEARELAQKYFSAVSGGKIVRAPKTTESQHAIAANSVFKKLDQTHFTLGFKAFPASSDKKYALALLADVLGGGMSSRLFQKVREELGAAYYIGASTTLYATHGFLDISAGVNHGKTEAALKAIMEELKLITRNGVTDKELARVKEHRIGTFLLSLETSSDLAFYYGEQEATLGTVTAPQDAVERLKKVTKSDIARLAKEVIKNSKLNFAVVGPYRSAAPFKKLLSL